MSIDIVGYRLSMNSKKYICRSVAVDLKYVTDTVELSMKIFQEHCRAVVVGVKFDIDKVKMSMKNMSVIVGLLLSDLSL